MSMIAYNMSSQRMECISRTIKHNTIHQRKNRGNIVCIRSPEISNIYEPVHEKTNNLGSDQV